MTSRMIIETSHNGMWLLTYEQPDMSDGQRMSISLLHPLRPDLTLQALERSLLEQARKLLDDILARHS